MKEYFEEIRALRDSLTKQVDILQQNAEDDNVRWQV